MQHVNDGNNLLRSRMKVMKILKSRLMTWNSKCSSITMTSNLVIRWPSTSPKKTPNALHIFCPGTNPIRFLSPRLIFSYILQQSNSFSFSEGSNQDKAMTDQLHQGEFPSFKGKTKFCGTSCGIFSLSFKFRVLTTSYFSESIFLLQNYTVSEPPMEISAPKIVACHMLPYPYAVFYCDSQESDNKLYKVLLEGDDGGRVEAAAMCHMDTSQWNPNHNAFPGASPVCHFFPSDNLVWIPIT